MSIPTFYYKHNVESNSDFVIDFSSLLIIFQIYTEHVISFPKKFIISNYIVERIKQELIKQKNDVKPAMSLSVTLTDVIPHIYSNKSSENDIKFLDRLLQWITDFCIIETSTSFPDFSRNVEFDEYQKPFFSYILNTALLVEPNKRILITDDSCYLKFSLLSLAKQCSSEMFIKHILGDNHLALDEFLLNNYQGFSPSAQQLNNEYTKKISIAANNYNICLKNINLINNPVSVMPAIGHIKDIALRASIVTDQQERDIVNVFVNLLRNSGYGIRTAIENMVKLKCFLLGQKLDMILRALRHAYLILDGDI